VVSYQNPTITENANGGAEGRGKSSTVVGGKKSTTLEFFHISGERRE